jgi:hypothetical protein
MFSRPIVVEQRWNGYAFSLLAFSAVSVLRLSSLAAISAA